MKKRLLSLLLSLALVVGIALPAASAQAAKSGGITVTLRIEEADGTLAPPREITLTQKDLQADYGLALKDPGYLTAYHAMAEYFMLYEGAARENMAADYIGLSASGYLQTIMGSRGAADEELAENCGWMFAVNDKTPIDPATGYGYLMNEYPLQNGDDVVIYGIDYYLMSYYAAFDKTEYTAQQGEPVTVTLKGTSVYDYSGGAPSDPLGGAYILCDKLAPGVASAATPLDFTDENGQCTLTFSEPGAYLLSAVRYDDEEADLLEPDISRPWAVVKVTPGDSETAAETAKLQSAAKALSFLTVAGGNTGADSVVKDLSLPASAAVTGGTVDFSAPAGADGVSIRWSASDTAVSNTGKVTRPGLNQKDKRVILTATLSSVKYQGLVDDVAAELSVTVKAHSNELAGLTLSSGSYALDDAGNATIFVDENCDTLTFAPILRDPTAAYTVQGAAKEGDAYRVGLSDGITVSVSVTAQNVTAERLLTFTKVPGGLPDYSAEWDSFRSKRMGLTNAKTPIEGDNVKLSWSKKLTVGWEGLSSPVIVNENIYAAVGDKLLKLDKQGNLLKTGAMQGSIGYFSYLAYGEGMIFASLGDGRIQAMDADTLQPLWITARQQGALQAISPLLYNDGYLYTGLCSSSGEEGLYLCLDVADEDAARPDEIKEFTWSYSPKTGSKGYYWSGGAVAGNAVLFGGDNGELVSHGLLREQVLDTVSLDGKIRAGVLYDEKSGCAFVTTQAGSLYKIAVNGDGTFGSVSSVRLLSSGSPASTSTPVLYNGRVYVGGGDYDTGLGFAAVVDVSAMQVVYTAELPADVKSSFLLSTGYAAEGNKQTVYAYFTVNDGEGGVYYLKDFEGNKKADVKKLFVPAAGLRQYCTASVIADKDGALYYTNDSGALFALGLKRAPGGEEGGDSSAPSEEENPGSSPNGGANTGDGGFAPAAVLFLISAGAAAFALRKRRTAGKR